VYKELLELYGMISISAVKYEDLQHMRYLDYVIKKPLKLFPTVPLIGRQPWRKTWKCAYFFFKSANIINFFL